MHPKAIEQEVKNNRGTSKTGHNFFDENGYLVVKNICNPDDLFYELPIGITGQLKYGKTEIEVEHTKDEGQVDGSLSRYSHPKYRKIHTDIRLKIEKIIGKKLCNTYYYDRFYFPNQELVKHVDRDACEISVSIHIGSNIDVDWAFELTTPHNEDKKLFLSPGDGIIYKGCEIPHWREKLQVKKSPIDLLVKQEQKYYHQIFFHYVLMDGYRCQYANDYIR